MEKCQDNKPATKVGDMVEWDGFASLLASNRFKHLGIELLLVDTATQSTTDDFNDVMVAIIGYILADKDLRLRTSRTRHHLIY